MDYLRTMVSGKKKRFIEDGYNLDLTYITERVIAMAFPAQGFESVYRNPIQKVSKMLEQRHGKTYRIINLSNRNYDFTQFSGKVESYDWHNHHAPQLHLLFLLCQRITDFLQENKENTIIIHCLAGKGRTGTLICCLLLYCGMFNNLEQVLQFYEKQRFNCTGLGVNQPCQIRYVEYFLQILNGNDCFPTIKYLSQIILELTPRINMDNGCKVFAKIYQNKQLIKQTQIVKINKDQKMTTLIILPQPLVLVGDILIEFIDQGLVKNRNIMRISFNTSFEKKSFGKIELDPSSVATDTRFPNDFKVHLSLSEYCNNCDNHTKSEDKCKECKEYLQQLYQSWQIIEESKNFPRQLSL